ncbi:MAG TPA: hypothetical protein VK797_00740 [Tepidisphaeraceae bacterium]|jgi:hypothetical protein|nr:hypothetical protein [Tepidisphaeraceae bacterium]
MRTSSMTPILAFLLLAGCTAPAPRNPYAPGPSEAIPVPPGARLIAYGHFPLPAFVVPADAAALYVYDEEARRVVFVTNYQSAGAVQPGGTTDLAQLSKNSFDPNHSYRVYYIPASVAAATQPASGQQ